MNISRQSYNRDIFQEQIVMGKGFSVYRSAIKRVFEVNRKWRNITKILDFFTQPCQQLCVMVA